MKKKTIRLTESELKHFIAEAVRSIITETQNQSWHDYFTVDFGDIDFDDPELDEFFETLDNFPDVEVGFNYSIEAYDPGDYWTPPSGGGADVTDYKVDVDGTYKNILPDELYQRFIGYAEDTFLSQIESRLEEIYDDYINYEREYESEDW